MKGASGRYSPGGCSIRELPFCRLANKPAFFFGGTLFLHRHRGGSNDPFVELLIAIPAALAIAALIIWIAWWSAQ